MLVEYSLHHAGEHVPALLEEEVGERKQALRKVFIEPSHHVGQAALGVAPQEIDLEHVVTILAFVHPDAAGEVMAAEVEHGVLELSSLPGDLGGDPDAPDPEPRAVVGVAGVVKPMHPPGVDRGLVLILLE